MLSRSRLVLRSRHHNRAPRNARDDVEQVVSLSVLLLPDRSRIIVPTTAVIIEDEVLVAWDLRLMCEDLGLNVLGIAHSAPQARKELPPLAPNVVLTDMQLGHGGDGADVAAVFRQSCPEATIGFITAATDAASLARISAARPDFVLAKPMSARDLEGALSLRRA